jgi:hypothetical protein
VEMSADIHAECNEIEEAPKKIILFFEDQEVKI